MSTVTFRRPTPATLLDGPTLVSELPAAGTTGPVVAERPGLLQRVRTELAVRREQRSFERALAESGHAQAHDLLALRRRD
jgi:hypothetical protein